MPAHDQLDELFRLVVQEFGQAPGNLGPLLAGHQSGDAVQRNNHLSAVRAEARRRPPVLRDDKLTAPDNLNERASIELQGHVLSGRPLREVSVNRCTMDRAAAWAFGSDCCTPASDNGTRPAFM